MRICSWFCSALALTSEDAGGTGLRALALPLLVAQVFADDHDATVTTNDLALVADRLDARLDLHGLGLSSYVAVESYL